MDQFDIALCSDTDNNVTNMGSTRRKVSNNSLLLSCENPNTLPVVCQLLEEDARSNLEDLEISTDAYYEQDVSTCYKDTLADGGMRVNKDLNSKSDTRDYEETEWSDNDSCDYKIMASNYNNDGECLSDCLLQSNDSFNVAVSKKSLTHVEERKMRDIRTNPNISKKSVSQLKDKLIFYDNVCPGKYTLFRKPKPFLSSSNYLPNQQNCNLTRKAQDVPEDCLCEPFCQSNNPYSTHNLSMPNNSLKYVEERKISETSKISWTNPEISKDCASQTEDWLIFYENVCPGKNTFSRKPETTLSSSISRQYQDKLDVARKIHNVTNKTHIGISEVHVSQPRDRLSFNENDYPGKYTLMRKPKSAFLSSISSQHEDKYDITSKPQDIPEEDLLESHGYSNNSYKPINFFTATAIPKSVKEKKRCEIIENSLPNPEKSKDCVSQFKDRILFYDNVCPGKYTLLRKPKKSLSSSDSTLHQDKCDATRKSQDIPEEDLLEYYHESENSYNPISFDMTTRIPKYVEEKKTSEIAENSRPNQEISIKRASQLKDRIIFFKNVCPGKYTLLRKPKNTLSPSSSRLHQDKCDETSKSQGVLEKDLSESFCQSNKAFNHFDLGIPTKSPNYVDKRKTREIIENFRTNSEISRQCASQDRLIFNENSYPGTRTLIPNVSSSVSRLHQNKCDITSKVQDATHSPNPGICKKFVAMLRPHQRKYNVTSKTQVIPKERTC